MFGIGQDEPAIPPAVASTLERIAATGVPPESIVFFGRWWQLETWLRLLVYIELRAAKGSAWSQGVQAHAGHGPERDAVNAYMASPDAETLLAYLDAGTLLDVIADEHTWQYWEYALLPRERWLSTADMLRQLRNRNAHCRRPHPDDLGRLEQLLRDLEAGARKAITAYNRQSPVPESLDDPVADGWVRLSHPDARRLVRHVERNYDITFRLNYSRRPWVEGEDTGRISGQPGYLWHAEWYLRSGRYLSPRRFWEDSRLDRRDTRSMIVHTFHPYFAQVGVTFSAVDEPGKVNDAIGACFDTVVTASTRIADSVSIDPPWPRPTDLDWRVNIGTALELMTDDTPFSLFEARQRP